MTRKLFVQAVAVLWLCGCASVPEDAGFAEVESTVTERLGKSVRWNRGESADLAATEAVRTLLARGLTADAATQIALLENRRLQATYESLGVAQAHLVEAGLLKNPIFGGEMRFFSSGVGIEGSIVASFVDLFAIALRKRVAAAEFAAVRARVAAEVIELAGEVRTEFLRYQAAEDTAGLLRKAVAAADASAELADGLHDSGNATLLDVANHRAFFEVSKLELAAAEAQARELRERLNAFMGLTGGATAWKTAGALPQPPEIETAGAGLEERALERNLDLMAARADLEAAEQRLGQSPWINVFQEGEAGANTERRSEDGEWGVGPEISLPLPIWNQGQPRVAADQAEVRRRRALLAALEVEIRAGARAAETRVSAARARVKTYRDVVLPLHQTILDETQKHYNAMSASLFQLLDAKQRQLASEREHVVSLRDYWITRGGLDQLLAGRLSPPELVDSHQRSAMELDSPHE